MWCLLLNPKAMNLLKVQHLKDIAVKSIDLKGNYVFYSKFKKFEAEITSPYYVINLPLSGEEDYVVEKRHFKVTNDKFLLTNPGEKKISLLNSETTVESLSLCLEGKFLNNLMGDVIASTADLLGNPFRNRETNTCFTHTYRLEHTELSIFLSALKINHQNNRVEELYQSDMFFMKLGTLLLESQKSVNNTINTLPQLNKSNREEIFRRSERMNQYIHDNFTENLSLEELSGVACLSKYHAVRCYQRIYGITPYQKIINLRLELAKSFLLKGDSIKTIASKANFTDYRAFSKAFRKVYGIAPSKFRTLFSE